MKIIIYSLRDYPVHVIQDRDTVKEAWDKLKSWLAGQTMTNKINTFKTLLNMRLRADGNVGDHIPTIKSKMSRLTSVGS